MLSSKGRVVGSGFASLSFEFVQGVFLRDHEKHARLISLLLSLTSEHERHRHDYDHNLILRRRPRRRLVADLLDRDADADIESFGNDDDPYASCNGDDDNLAGDDDAHDADDDCDHDDDDVCDGTGSCDGDCDCRSGDGGGDDDGDDGWGVEQAVGRWCLWCCSGHWRRRRLKPEWRWT